MSNEAKILMAHIQSWRNCCNEESERACAASAREWAARRALETLRNRAAQSSKAMNKLRGERHQRPIPRPHPQALRVALTCDN